MDFNRWVRWRHKTPRQRKMETAMMGRVSKDPDSVCDYQREFHTMKCFVNTVRQVLPQEDNEHTNNRG